MAKKRLEFTSGKFSKFWEISVKGSTHTVCYGKIGTKGVEKTKEFDSPKEAKAAAEKLSQQKLSKGYKTATKSAAKKVAVKTKVPVKKKATVKKKTTKKTKAVSKPVKKTATRSTRKKVAGKNAPVKQSMTRIKRWLTDNHPLIHQSFRKPATKTAISKVEKQIGLKFPDDVKDYFLFTDGFDVVNSFVFVDLFTGWGQPIELGDVAKIRKRWLSEAPDVDKEEIWTEKWTFTPKDAIKPTYFHPGWIPLSDDIQGLAIDFEPGPKGTVGQLINFGRWDIWHRTVIADSLGQYLERLANKMEAGKIRFYDEDEDLPIEEKYALTYE